MDADGNELECRVCRGGPEDDRKLFFPCMCSGSIGAVHQDCLEAWLNHSKKDTCELCATKYKFEPHYADGMPTVIPLRVFAKTILKSSILRLFPALLRLAFAFGIWVFVVPILTSTIYCMCVGRSISLSFSDWTVVRGQIVHGFAIDAVIALSLLILISFTDFLRFHLVPAPPAENAAGNANNPVEGVAVVDNAGVAAGAVVEDNNNPLAHPAALALGHVAVPGQIHQQHPLQQMQQQQQQQQADWQPRPHAPAAMHVPPQPHSPIRLDGNNAGAAGGAGGAGGIYSRRDNPLYRDIQAPTIANRDTRSSKRSAEEEGSDTEWETEDEHTDFPPAILDHPSPLRPFTRSQLRQRNTVTDHTQQHHQHQQHQQHQHQQHQHQQQQSKAMNHLDTNPYHYDSESEGDDDVGRLGRGFERSIHDDFEVPDLEEFNFNFNIPHNNNNNDAFNPAHHAHNNLHLPLADPLPLPRPDQNQHEPDEINNNNNNNNNNINNDDFINNAEFNDPDDPNFDNLNDADLQEANVEIRLAIFEILGVEGPFHLMFRNSFWLLGFCALYLFFTAMVPYMIGTMLSKLVVVYVGQYEVFLVPQGVRTLYELIVQHSAETVPLQFLDFFYIFGGCCGIFSAVFLLDGLSQALLLLKMPNAIKTVLELVGKLATVVKVGCLLLVRIFILPLCLGTAVMVVAAHVLLPYTASQWARFIALHCLGAFAVAWVTGITFMLTMTISVLQLREVLHPAILAKVIRPQEPHAELINSLMQEGGLVHIRRIFVSLCVYLLLMLLLLYLPMLEYTYLRDLFYSTATATATPTTSADSVVAAAVESVNVIYLATAQTTATDTTVTATSSHFFDFVFWYVIPEIQIPLELMMSHLTFLSLLDKHKDVIGRCQHVVLVWLCDKLGLTRFVLPCPQLSVRRQASASFAIPVDPPAEGNQNINININNRPAGEADATGAAAGAATAGAEPVAEFVPLRVGPPLRRPPAGWDIRTPNQSTRWAWATEEPSALERSVAARVTPSHWALRCAALVAVCFLLLHAAALFFLTVPLALGRGLAALVYVPRGIRHDPLHFVVGCMLCASIASGIVARLPKWEKLKEMVAGARKLSRNLILSGIVMFSHLALAHVLVAVLIHTLSSVPLSLQFLWAALSDSPIPEVTGSAAAVDVAGVAALPDFDLALVSLAWSALLADWPSHLQMLCVSVIAVNVCRLILCSQTIFGYLESVAQQHPHSVLAALYHWVIALKLVPMEIRLALNIADDVTLRNQVLSQKVRNVTHHVLRPLIAELFLQCLLVAGCIAVGLHWVDMQYFPAQGYTWKNEFQMGVLFYIARRGCVLSYYPLCSAAAALHKQVLNDNYLIGRTLVNNHPQQQSPASPAPTVA